MTLLLDRAAQQAALDLKRILVIDDEEPIRSSPQMRAKRANDWTNNPSLSFCAT